MRVFGGLLRKKKKEFPQGLKPNESHAFHVGAKAPTPGALLCGLMRGLDLKSGGKPPLSKREHSWDISRSLE